MMYNPLSGCSALLHLLLKYPILVVGLGVVGATNYFTPPDTVDEVVPAVERKIVYQEASGQEALIPVGPVQTALLLEATENTKTIFHEEIAATEELQSAETASVPEQAPDVAALNEQEELNRIVKTETEKWFEAIKQTESSGDSSIGVHSDGVSFGPAGLTEIALREVLRKLPNCSDLGYNEILNDPEASTHFAYLYFLDQIHRFGNIEVAVIAYNNGPTTVRRWQRERRELPVGYLNRVKKNL